MDVEIKNCNNIMEWNIHIEEWKINVFYWINWTWKSTISKAIDLKIKSWDLENLRPFWCQDNPDVALSNPIENILIFNEDYVNKFTYRQDELVSNSFEILIRTDQYKENERRINELLSWIKGLFENNEALDTILQDFLSFKSCFKWNNDWWLSRQSEFHKAYWDWNFIENIPEWLSWYKPFIQSQNCTQRIDWQTKWNQFWNDIDVCPYCASNIVEKKNDIKLVSETYNKNDIEKLVKIQNIVDELWEYFSETAIELINQITRQANWLSLEQNNFLKRISDEICTLYAKLLNLKTISFESFSGCDNIDEKLDNFKIDLALINDFQSEHTQSVINWFNLEIDSLKSRIWNLIWLINIQKQELRNLVTKYKTWINSFLEKAWYKYEVDIPSDQNYKLRLKAKWIEWYLSWWNQYLSFWEKNAFALILFMYEAISKEPDLIVLDDPISSFDENKKYAIIHTLFTWTNSLNWKNVIMFTHDMEPIIDMKKVRTDIFNNCCTYFIDNNDWILKATEILKDDVLSFYQIWEKIGNSEENDIVKLVYLRKLYNWLNDNGDEYQVLSNLLHWRPKQQCLDSRNSPYIPLDEENFCKWIEGIKDKRETFDYDYLLEILSNKEKMLSIYNETNSNLTKIIIFRRIYDIVSNETENIIDNGEDIGIDEIVNKFINEEYHIENSYLYWLDPMKFDIIPSFIIKKCDLYINSLTNS